MELEIGHTTKFLCEYIESGHGVFVSNMKDFYGITGSFFIMFSKSEQLEMSNAPGIGLKDTCFVEANKLGSVWQRCLFTYPYSNAEGIPPEVDLSIERDIRIISPLDQCAASNELCVKSFRYPKI